MKPTINENGKQYLLRPVMERSDVVEDAIYKCLDAMFQASYPSITLEEYKKQHEEMTEEERENAKFFESHYLPKNQYETILDDIAAAYQLKSDLPDTIQILKNYFCHPLVDYRGGEFAENYPEPMSEEIYKEVEKYLDMANDFFKWDADYNNFVWSVSNVGPCCNRNTVEKWWHEHGDPDFKLPADDFWRDEWYDEEEDPQC